MGWFRVGAPLEFKSAVLGGYRGGEDRLSFCPHETHSLAGKKKIPDHLKFEKQL